MVGLIWSAVALVAGVVALVVMLAIASIIVRETIKVLKS